MTSPPTTRLEPFACPACRAALRLDDRLRCSACGTTYLAADGVAAFNDAGMYHGPILPKSEMQKVFALARERGHEYVLTEYLPAHHPDFARYITSPGRRGGLRFLGLTGRERVLDFGCAFGVLALEIAKRAAVVAALDVTREKIEFLQIVKEQRGLDHVFPVCSGDPLRLPFADGFFDWVILNAVFEYLPESIAEPDVDRAHLLALREVHRVLRPGGRVYLASKNRYSYRLLLGDRDQSGLRFTSVLPRRIANWLTMTRRGQPYRIISHSFIGYQKLFAAAGFAKAAFYAPFPSLQYPDQFVPLTVSTRELTAGLATVKSRRTLRGAPWHAAAHLGLFPHLIPHYVIVATR
jgi:SAM-dependent methyltransferase